MQHRHGEVMNLLSALGFLQRVIVNSSRYELESPLYQNELHQPFADPHINDAWFTTVASH